jgi:hypothetical protein
MSSPQGVPGEPWGFDLSARWLLLSVEQIGVAERSAFARRREWLARQMQAAVLDYLQQDNCFPWIANWTKAQRLMDRQLKTRWPKLLNGIACQLNPISCRDLP